MKIRRVAAIAVFLLTSFVSKAQAAGTKVGFIAMFTQSNGNVPTVIQAEGAYDRMLPKLLSLQKSGLISEFEPELRVGVVKVVYSTAGNLSDMTGMQSYSDMNAAIAKVPQVKSVHPRAPVGPSVLIDPEFDMSLYDSCFAAFGVGASDFVVGKLQDRNLRVVDVFAGSADGSGDINDACFSYNGIYSDVTPGYRVTFNIYSDSSLANHLGGPFVAGVPNLKFTAIDKTHAVVGGKGPVGKQYEVYWDHPDLNASHTDTSSLQTGTIPASGVWSKDMSASHFRGGDYLQLVVKQNPVFFFDRIMFVPYIYCVIGGDYCNDHGFAGMPASLSIKHAGITHTRTGYFDPFGFFNETLMNSFNPIFLKAGDKAWGTSVPVFTLPNLTDSVNFATNVVSGKAPPSKYFFVEVNLPFPSSIWYEIWAHSSSLGNYHANFTSDVDLVPSMALNFDVYYLDPSTGNLFDFYSTYSPH